MSIGNRSSLMARIARLESIKTQLQRRFIYFGGNNTGTNSNDTENFVWRKIDTAFENRILSDAMINTDYIEPRQFLEDAGCVVLEQMQDVIERHNGEYFSTMNLWQVINVLIKTSTREIMNSSKHLCEWYERHIIESTLMTRRVSRT